MATDQESRRSCQRVTKLEDEVEFLRKQPLDSDWDWEARIIEQLNKDDLHAAISIYQDFVDRHASMSEALRHVLEIRKRSDNNQ